MDALPWEEFVAVATYRREFYSKIRNLFSV